MPYDLNMDDLQSVLSGQPSENMVTQGLGIGADPMPKRPMGDLTRGVGLPPLLAALLLRRGIKRGNTNPTQSPTIPTARPAAPTSAIGDMVRQHFGQDNNRNMVTSRSFPGTQVSGQQGTNPNMRAQSFNPTVEAVNSPMDRLANRRILTPANLTPGQAQNIGMGQARQNMTRSVDLIMNALRNKPKGEK